MNVSPSRASPDKAPPLRVKKEPGCMMSPQVVPQPSAPSRSLSGDNQEDRVSVSRTFVFYSRPLATVMFVLLGGLMALWRYGLDPAFRTPLIDYGPWLALGLHVWIVLLAWRDDCFSGILCLLVPGYSIYYLFFKCERVFLMAFFAGLMVGVAEDTWYSLQELAGHYHRQWAGWIRAD